MAVTFVLGRAGTGKTHHCLEAVLAELRRDESRPLIVLVPEQASFQTERALALRTPQRGYWRAEVLSFSRLARRVLQATGGEPPLLGRSSRELALRSILTRDPGLAGMFRGSARTPGFHAALERLIEELLSENVAPDVLRAAALQLEIPHTRTKVEQLARVYEAYLSWLGTERVDPAQRLALLRSRLECATFLNGAHVWVDGFAGFTGQETETLAALARHADHLTITLLLDPASGSAMQIATNPHAPVAYDRLDLFSRTETTYARLCRSFVRNGVSLTAPITLSASPPRRLAAAPQLARLEASFASTLDAAQDVESGAPQTATASSTPNQVRIVRCATHTEELREAARSIRRRVLESGGALRWSDFAVIARDLEPLAALAADIFSEYEIPTFIDRRRSLRVHPLGRLVQAIFDVVLSDFSVAATTRLLRTGLCNVSDDYAQQLDSYIITEQIRGAALWRKPSWGIGEPHLADSRVPGAPPAANAAVVLRRGDEMLRDRGAVEQPRRHLFAALEGLLHTAAEPNANGAAWARAIYAVLQKLRVPQQIAAWMRDATQDHQTETAETHRQAWEALVSVLDDIAAILGETPVDAREATTLVSGALSDLSIGLAPPKLDQVLVSAIERSRHPEIKHAWIVAVNGDVFPARPAEDALLTNEERAALAATGLPAPAPRREEIFGERLLAYIAFTRPSAGLTISFAAAGDDGRPLEQSPFIARVVQALPGVCIEDAPPNQPPLTPPEFARAYLAAHSAANPTGSQRARIKLLYAALSGAPSVREQVDRFLIGTSYRNETLPAPQLAALSRARGAATGPNAATVAITLTQLESHLRCPFKFYAEYGLRVRGPVAARAAEVELGNVAHRVLAIVTAAGMQEPGGVTQVSAGRWREMLRAAEQRVRADLPADLAERRPQLAFRIERQFALLADVVLANAARWKLGEFRPMFVEQAFGDVSIRNSLPPAAVALRDGRLAELTGRIDRVDGCEFDGQTALLAYDYKSWAAKLGERTILTGAWLQLFTYLLALRGGVRDARLAGAMIAPLRCDIAAAPGDGPATADSSPDAESADTARMRMLMPRGIIDGQLAKKLDGGFGPPEYSSPAAKLDLTKDGRFKKHADGRPTEDISARVALAEATIRFVAAGIAAGDTTVAPLVENRSLACNECELRSLCRFDRPLNHPRDAQTTLPSLPASADDDADAGETA